MVGGAFDYGSRLPLVFIPGSTTSVRYINEVLEPFLLPYLNGLHQPIFQQDNARRHIARRTLQFLNKAGVNISLWPARAPDLNPIEHVWEMIGRRLTTLHRPPQTPAELQHKIAWDQVPQEDIEHLISPMVKG
jgi:transposase